MQLIFDISTLRELLDIPEGIDFKVEGPDSDGSLVVSVDAVPGIIEGPSPGFVGKPQYTLDDSFPAPILSGMEVLVP